MEVVSEEVIEVRSRSHSPNKSKRRCHSNLSNSVSNREVFISVSSRNDQFEADKENKDGTNQGGSAQRVEQGKALLAHLEQMPLSKQIL